MELVKDIYFNTDKLVENTKVKVSYTGKFYQGNNDKVFIHYGYGENWNNVSEAEMVKTDLGYQTELDLVGGNTLNFCFKNQNNEWDNNCGKNYVFNIEKATTNKLGKTTFGVKPNSTVSFYDKTFGKTDENQITSNVYWKSNECQNLEGNNSGVIEDTVLGTPDSIDTFIQPTLNADIPQNVETPIANTTQINSQVINNTVANNNSQETINAIAVVNTGFQKTLIWTKKIKATVCNFFAYVPKLISGNYKRKIENKNNNIK